MQDLHFTIRQLRQKPGFSLTAILILALGMLAVADVGLYKAKDAGRNRVIYCEKPWNEILASPVTHRERCAGCKARSSPACVVADFSTSALG